MKRNKMLLFVAAHRYEYLDEDSPDPEESDPADRGPSLSASPPATPASPPAQAAAAPPGRAGPASPPGRPSGSGWDMPQMMWLAGGAGLHSVIARSDAAMPTDDVPVASERAGGESRRTGLKRKAAEITRSAAEDFALLTTQTVSARYAVDFLSTVTNVILIFFRNLYISIFILIFMWQPSYNSADVPYHSMKSLSKKIVSSMMPEAKVNRTSLHEGAYIIISLFRCI
jgi:hypothetical protein